MPLGVHWELVVLATGSPGKSFCKMQIPGPFSALEPEQHVQRSCGGKVKDQGGWGTGGRGPGEVDQS